MIKEYSGKWVEIDKYTKEKTIIELATECLINERLPKHLSEIIDYILEDRPELNKLSIMLALKSRENVIIKTFENDFFGLASKKYPIKFKEYNFEIRKPIAKIITNYLQNEVLCNHSFNNSNVKKILINKIEMKF